MEKYTTEYLLSNNLQVGWHEEQAEYIQSAIDNCKSSTLLIVVTDSFVLEAIAHVIFRYDFTTSKIGTIGAITISIHIK